jgi:hypothetical protein
MERKAAHARPLRRQTSSKTLGTRPLRYLNWLQRGSSAALLEVPVFLQVMVASISLDTVCTYDFATLTASPTLEAAVVRLSVECQASSGRRIGPFLWRDATVKNVVYYAGDLNGHSTDSQRLNGHLVRACGFFRLGSAGRPERHCPQ